MPRPRHSTAELLSPARPTPEASDAFARPAPPLPRGPHRRLRAVLLGAFALVGTLVVGQVWQLDEVQRRHDADQRVAALVQEEALLGLQIGHAAGQAAPAGDAGAPDAAALRAAMRRSGERAQQLEALLRQRTPADGTHAAEAHDDVDAALAAWRRSRVRLWRQAEALAAGAGAGDATEVAAALQREIAPAAQAAAALADTIARESAARGRAATATLREQALGGLALLALLGLAVGAPALRAVRRHHEAIAQRSAAELGAQASQRRQTAALLGALPIGVLVRGPDGEILDSNPAAETLLQLTAAQILGREPPPPGWHAVHADMRPMAAHEHPARVALATGRPLHGATMGVIGAGGHLRWLLVDVEFTRDAEGRIDGTIACFTDVTEQRGQQAVLQHTVEAAGLGTWHWEIGSGRMAYNDRLLAMLGWRRGEVAETMAAWSALVHADDRAAWQAAMRAHLADPTLPCRCELRVRRPDGDWASVLSCGVVIARDATGAASAMAGINIDMTEQTQMQAMLRHAGHTDGLTQLPNRAAVFEQVQQVIERAAREPGRGYAVLFMDVDRFKQINDTLGHSAGDELLRQIAQRLRGALRQGGAGRAPGHVAGRIGGDEFVVVLEDVDDRDAACTVARRLIEELSAPYAIGSTLVHSSASIGIVTAEHGAHDAATVMRDADTAMYEAKRLGRNRFAVFDPAMHERVARGVAIEADLRLALERHELYVVYQPVVELQGHGPGGIEALVRWRHPTRGLVSPLQFIGVAEDTGLIVEIGDFVLATACRQFAAWQRALGSLAPTSVAVNLSPAQLRAPGLVDAIRRCLHDSGVAPERLQLEVTESLAAQDDAARARLREIKALGVRIALDDFGTGYSSLACLHQLPVDTVKIDRSFVMHAETSDYHRVLIEATIRVAQTLGMGTVAEGIETEGQAALMRRLKCGRGQGYLFSRPLEADALTGWLAVREPVLQSAA